MTDSKKKSDQSQGDAFIRTAREIGCSEDEGVFDEALKRIASSPPPKSVEKRKTKKVGK